MTVVEIPTSLVVVIVTYLAGLYVSFIVAGWLSRWDNCDGLDAFIAVFWPFAVPIIAAGAVCNGLESAGRFVVKRFPKFTRWAMQVLSTLTLPFRPWRVGRLLRRQK